MQYWRCIVPNPNTSTFYMYTEAHSMQESIFPFFKHFTVMGEQWKLTVVYIPNALSSCMQIYVWQRVLRPSHVQCTRSVSGNAMQKYTQRTVPMKSAEVQTLGAHYHTLITRCHWLWRNFTVVLNNGSIRGEYKETHHPWRMSTQEVKRDGPGLQRKLACCLYIHF